MSSIATKYDDKDVIAEVDCLEGRHYREELAAAV